MDLYRPLDVLPSSDTRTVDVCLERYPRDLRRALMLAEGGHVSEGHTVLVQGLVDARAAQHGPLQQVYAEALGIYEARYAVAVN